MKEWQRGYELEDLKRITEIFKTYDQGLILGAFTGVKERTVADWLAAKELHLIGGTVPVGAVVLTRPRSAVTVKDFRGAIVARADAGSLKIARIAVAPPATIDDVLAFLQERTADESQVWFEGFIERETDRYIAEQLGLELRAVKIRASSELIGVWAKGARLERALPSVDRLALSRLALPHLDTEPLRAALEERTLSFEQHYSGYNKASSWTAVALRGFGGDPGFIIKPAEMSRKWKRENEEKLAWESEDTPARAAYPEAEALIAAVPGEKERIRLMRLEPGGGELTRHADITDPDAGTEPGQLLRIHIPIATNDGVRFEAWRLNGDRESCHMGIGSCWYLDTRKPHTARNDGETPRIHLVMDVFSCPDLLEMLRERAPLAG